MQHSAQKRLFDEISQLPFEKVGKALSFIRYLEQEPETELLLDLGEEAEVRELLASGDVVDSDEVFAKIKKLPMEND